VKLLLSNIWSSGDYQTATAFTNFANEHITKSLFGTSQLFIVFCNISLNNELNMKNRPTMSFGCPFFPVEMLNITVESGFKDFRK
jgi:hypothetical protein